MANRPPTMAITLFSRRAHAKTCNPRPVWEKHFGTRLSWRFPQKKRRSCQTRRTAWEKSKRKRFIMAITLWLDRAHAKTRGGGGGGKRMGTRLSWRFSKKKRESRQNRRPSTGLGKHNAKPVYLGDRETKHEWISEAVWIGETFWIGETVWRCPHPRNDRRQEAQNSSFAIPREREHSWVADAHPKRS